MGTETHMGRVFWAIALACLLTACNGLGHTPSKALIEQAIALQLEQVQQALSQELHLEDTVTELQINRVAIAQQTPLQINQLPSFRVTGFCDYTLQRPHRAIPQRHIPFEVFLQRQSEGKTWRVAFPQPTTSGEITWITQRIPTAVYK